MIVLGIDPAPSKGLTVFDGVDQHVPLGEARAFLGDVEARSDVLICWDAPLTGPPSSVLDGGIAGNSSYTQRPIESFFSRAATRYKTPKGISVRGYAGCPHWAVSRSLVGLPRTGSYDTAFEHLPFRLIASNPSPGAGKWIVEVHPAVALWLWCRDRVPLTQDWEYKKSADLVVWFWDLLLEAQLNRLDVLKELEPPRNDDELDARIAFALGVLWADGEDGGITLLGDLDAGTFLLPSVPGLTSAFREFRSAILKDQ